MDLGQSLRSIQSLSDLPRLIAELGHKPLWEQVPGEGWAKVGRGRLEVIAVGQSGAFPWFAVESSTPARDAVTLARHIVRRGRTGMVMSLDPRARRVALAVAYGRCPAIEQELDHPDPEALSSLGRLAGVPDGGSLAFAARAADALAAEPVTRRFFRAFRSTLDHMASGLSESIPAINRRELSLLHLTRVLFLYFIQAKGWLNGRERFLAEEVESCLVRRRRVHSDLLRPLFFGTLNQPVSERGASTLKFGRIPFLNGGLFEPHPLEKRHRADASNALWREAFDNLFERFHFTVSEQRDPWRIAPDMLGRVFEGVMDPEDRHSSGTFYTPAALVEQVLNAGLAALLSTRLHCTETEAERRLSDPDHAAAGLLSSVTVLDPAVGSGAFLLKALERLARCGSADCQADVRKRQILRRNLFGVDRNAAAVRLAQLRLWLAVVADDPSESPETVSPLPNIDCLIRQGDSLFDPVGFGVSGGSPRPDPALAAELAALRQEVIGAAGPGKHRLTRRLRALELRAMSSCLAAAEQLHQGEMRECLDQARTQDLFGQRRGLDSELRSQVGRLRAGLRALRRARRQLDQESELPWFHYQSHFADVFARGGFDLIIGNPPWLRSEAIPQSIRRQLIGRYRWWKSGSYGRAPDLAVAFIERGLELAAPEGIVAMLIPAKLTTAGYGVAARHALASSTTIHVVADLTGTSQAAFDATVYPLALVVGKAAPAPEHGVRTDLQAGKGDSIRQSELRGGGPWILIRRGLHSTVATLQQDHPPLGSLVTCHLGVKTGLNRVFLDPPSSIEAEVVRWALRGRDVLPFRCRCRVRLLWTHDPAGSPCRRLPSKARAYLQQFERQLRARHDYRGGPPWSLFRTRAAAARYRVVWSDLARRMAAVALTGTPDLLRVPLNSCYVAPVQSAALAHTVTAWLNSTWIGAVARLGATPASGGFARFNAQVVARLPLPATVLQENDFARLGRQARSGEPVQEQLDDLAARHLNLSSSTRSALRAVVAGSTCNRR